MTFPERRNRILAALAAAAGWIKAEERAALDGHLARPGPIEDALTLEPKSREALRAQDAKLVEDELLLDLLAASGTLDPATRQALYAAQLAIAAKGKLARAADFLVAQKKLDQSALKLADSLRSGVSLSCACGASYACRSPGTVKTFTCPRCGASNPVARSSSQEERTVIVGATPAPKAPKVGAYEIVRQLGQGGMGAVYEARGSDGAAVALKVMLPDQGSEDGVKRFVREARAASRVQHKNIVRCLDSGTDEAGRHFIAMEFVSGEDLYSLLKRRGAIPLAEALPIFDAILDGVAAAHDAGVVHRDLKPQNVLVGHDGAVKVADFGLARRSEESLAVTAAGQILGTPRYISPEQCDGKPADARSDIYSLGATFYHVLTGAPPYEGKSISDIIFAHLKKTAVHPSQVNQAIPGPLGDVILKMMAKDPGDRFPDCRAIKAALAAARSDGGTEVAAPIQLPPVPGGDASGELRPGTKVGSLTISRKIGAGGMGTVYRAEHAALGKSFAVKVLPSAVAKDPVRKNRFLREARLTAALGHPNIVAVTDFVEEEGRLHLVMEFVDGPTLKDIIAREGRIAPPRAVGFACGILDALAAAHARGIVHRDIKPENILVDASNTPKLTDFGVARGGEEELTQSGDLLGTPAYMAPEQASGKTVDARADVYSLGATLYHMLSGRRPYQGDGYAAILGQLLTQDPPDLCSVAPEVPPPLAAACHRMMKRDPAERYPDAQAAARALRAALEGKPEEAPPAPPRRRGSRLVRGAIAVLAILAAMGVIRSAAQRRGREFRDSRRGDVPVSSMPASTGSVEPGQRSPDHGILPPPPPPHPTPTPEIEPVEQPGDVVRPPVEPTPTPPVVMPPTQLPGPTPPVEPTPPTPPVVEPTPAPPPIVEPTTPPVEPATPPVAPPPTAPPALPAEPSVPGQVLCLRPHDDSVTAAAVSPDGRRAVTGDRGGVLYLWSLPDGEQIESLDEQDEPISGLAFGPDGSYVLSASEDGTVCEWDMEDTDESEVVLDEDSGVAGVVVSPRDDVFAATLVDGTEVFVDTAESDPVGEDQSLERIVESAFTPSGSRLVIGTREGHIAILEVPGGGLVRNIAEGVGAVQGVAVDPSGRVVAAALRDRTIRLYAADGRDLGTIRPGDAVNDLAFSPDSTRLAAGCDDGSVRVYGLDGSLLATFQGHARAVLAVAIGGDGHYLVSGGRDHTVRVWDLGTLPPSPAVPLTGPTLDEVPAVAPPPPPVAPPPVAPPTPATPPAPPPPDLPTVLTDLRRALAEERAADAQRAADLARTLAPDDAEVRRLGREAALLAARPDGCVLVRAGTYTVGANPPRTATVPDFYIGAAEVTNAQFREFVDATTGYRSAVWPEGTPQEVRNLRGGPEGWRSQTPAADLAVTMVTPWESQAYCLWLSQRIERTVRLPMEDEWEVAARGPDALLYSWGPLPDAGIARYQGPPTGNTTDRSWCGALGLGSNVAEWALDPRGGSYVMRGGSHRSADPVPATFRQPPIGRLRPLVYVGFRILVEAPGE